VGPDEVWRRIPPRHFVVKEGRSRPSGGAFEDDTDDEPVSVVLASLVISDGRPPESVLAGLEGFALAGVMLEVLDELSLEVQRDPLPDEPAHCRHRSKNQVGATQACRPLPLGDPPTRPRRSGVVDDVVATSYPPAFGPGVAVANQGF
jgi:hypothetical protein